MGTSAMGSSTAGFRCMLHQGVNTNGTTRLRRRVPITRSAARISALAGVGTNNPTPAHAMSLTECRFVELDLALAPEIVRDLLPGNGSRIKRFLRSYLTRERPRELGLRRNVVLEDPGNPRLDRPVGVIIRISLRGQVRSDELGWQPRAGPQLFDEAAISVRLEPRWIECHPGAQILVAEVRGDAPRRFVHPRLHGSLHDVDSPTDVGLVRGKVGT